MSPRRAAARDDATASLFLDAAAGLIDAAFVDADARGRHRTNALRYPAAIDWLRIEDVVEHARQLNASGVSRKAFYNRWPDKDSFINDAVAHALLYRDVPTRSPGELLTELRTIGTDSSPSAAIQQFCESFMAHLSEDPRSFLLIHLAPFITLHADLHEALLAEIATSRRLWRGVYQGLLEELGLKLKPGWTIRRLDLALQSMCDGFLLRARLEPEETAACACEEVSLYADTVSAFLIGILAEEGDSRSSRQTLDSLVPEREM